MLNGTELAVTGFRAEENDRKNGDNHRCTEEQENGADSKLILNQVTAVEVAEGEITRLPADFTACYEEQIRGLAERQTEMMERIAEQKRRTAE